MAIIRVEEKEKFFVAHLESDFVSTDDINLLRSTLKELSQKENNRLIINLGKTNFLSSASLGVLLSGNAMFEKNDGQIVLCCASDYIENLFKITKLNLIFKIFPTQFDAERYFTKLPAEEK